MDDGKLHDFMMRFVGDLGAAMHAATAVVGDRLGLYKAMAEGGPMTPAELAKKTETHERYVQEWLNAQAASSYASYDADSGKYSLSEEQAACLADESSPTFLMGGFQIAGSTFSDADKVVEAFKTGKGINWGNRHSDLYSGCERFFRPIYSGQLVESWIPALGGGVKEKLEAGGSVADVGCGHGSSTILMAKAFPKSTFKGFDLHEESISTARERAEKEGVADRVSFEVASSSSFPGDGYDLVTNFDCLHDMGDPVSAAKHVRQSLSESGTWLVVEPFANDKAEDNHNPVGRVFYSVSTTVCTPASLAQDVGLGLGAQAGEGRLRKVAEEGGFTQFERAAETPFNLVFAARA